LSAIVIKRAMAMASATRQVIVAALIIGAAQTAKSVQNSTTGVLASCSVMRRRRAMAMAAVARRVVSAMRIISLIRALCTATHAQSVTQLVIAARLASVRAQKITMALIVLSSASHELAAVAMGLVVPPANAYAAKASLV
jgi:hypothetical protein